MITQSNRRYKLLDLLRLFCACLVIFIHMGLGDDVAFVPCMTRQARFSFWFPGSSSQKESKTKRVSRPSPSDTSSLF